jgi:hypothetical protein
VEAVEKNSFTLSLTSFDRGPMTVSATEMHLHTSERHAPAWTGRAPSCVG